MKKSILHDRTIVTLVGVGLMLVFSSMSRSQQQNIDPPRVALDFPCPTYTLPGNTPITMYAEVMGAKQLLDEETAGRIKFRWQITGGTLHSGQGSGKIVFDSMGLSSNPINVVNVKLEITSAPPELESERSCSVRIESGCITPQLIDEYSEVSLVDEHKHLDRIAEYLKRTGPQSLAYVVSYMGRRACIWENEWRGRQAKKYLVKEQNISANRIVVVDGGAREHWEMTLFVQTSGTCGPIPTPTVPRHEVLMRGQCSTR